MSQSSFFFLYFIVGCGIAAYFIGFPTSRPDRSPANESIRMFFFRNGTPLFQDPVTLKIYAVLSLATLALLIVSAFSAVFLTGNYLHWRRGSAARTVHEDLSEYAYIPDLTPTQICRLILIPAWLACLTMTGVYIIGIPFRDGIWVFYAVWILAILQTLYVWKMHQEYGYQE